MDFANKMIDQASSPISPFIGTKLNDVSVGSSKDDYSMQAKGAQADFRNTGFSQFVGN